MDKISKIIIKYRSVIIAIIGVITIFLGIEATRIKINPDIISYFPKSDGVVKVFRRVGKHFGGNEIAMVAIKSDSLFSVKMLKQLSEITDSLNNMEGISSVIDIVNTIDISSDNGEITIKKLIDEYNLPVTDKEINKLKEKLRNNDMYTGTVISKDLKTALILCRISEGYDEMNVVKKIDGFLKRNIANSTIYEGGVPFLLLAINRSILHDIKLLIPILVVIMILILFLSFRSVRGVIIPLITVTISIIWTIGVMVIAGKEFTILSDIIPVVLLAVGSAYSIHILSKYEELEGENMSAQERAEKSLSSVFLPVTLAAVTTMVGFVSFIFGSFFNMIKEFGIFSSIGVFFAFILSVLIVPISLSFLSDKEKFKAREEKSKLSSSLYRTNKFILKHEKIGLIFASLILIVAVIGTFFIQRKVSYTDYFGKNSRVRKSETLISREFGGSSIIEILAEGDPKDPHVLDAIYKFENYMKNLRDVNNTNSIADIIVKMNDVISGKKEIPNSKMKVNNLWFLLEGEEAVENLVDLNNNESLLQASLKSDLSLKRSKSVINKIEMYSKTHSDSLVKFYVTGMPLINIKLDESIIKSLIWSLIISFVSILIILILLTRSFVGGVFGVTPVAFTLILIYGVMGLAKIPLDIATALVGSISIGVGIDYSIHFIERFRKEIANKGKYDALKTTLNTTGKAIFINMTVVISGFCVLIFASLIPLRRFGILISVTMIGSAFGATVILSSIIMSIKKKIFNRR